ncbi:MAG TPA: glycosyltransferase [Deltaproteobacteria bacterium]|nr:glycosyltransferase [Deltaproteobacteria bacterium]
MSNINNDITVWLSYVGYPVTTAVYFERAFRSMCRTITVGPPMPEELVERWHLQNMKLPPVSHDIVTDFSPNMAEILRHNSDKPKPDIYLWIESVPGHCPLNLQSLGCPTACYLIDSHLNLERHLERCREFDFAFIAQREYLPAFREVNPKTFWLPLGCDPEVHRRWPVEKQFDAGFVGGVSSGSMREQLLQRLSMVVGLKYERCFWDDMARLFSSSRMVFNNAVRNDLNMRIFEVMSIGTLLLSDMARNSGQDELFMDGEDYACYHAGNLEDTARFYLENEALCERIARRGQRLVHNAHTYNHRVGDLLDVALGGKPNTFSAAELRTRSLAGVSAFIDDVRLDMPSVPVRSFVIPVLDYSPASEYNILTLLDDLTHIEGEVIAVFNGASVGEELKGHPRITRHAIMKQNVGVARGWNIGLSMAEADTVFIVNADVHIERAAVDAVEQGLKSLPLAACVGPQGSFVDFSRCNDYCYFDRSSFSAPLEVDAVSGFFFAVNRRQFNEHGIRFEECYTPCYFEEWDIGMQIRRAGLKNYVVPTTAYEHHWSGTIRALRSIPYMGKDETVGEILLRNRQYFLAKWRDIARQTGRPDLLESGWKRYMISMVKGLLVEGNSSLAAERLKLLSNRFPEDFEIVALARYLSLC